MCQDACCCRTRTNRVCNEMDCSCLGSGAADCLHRLCRLDGRRMSRGGLLHLTGDAAISAVCCRAKWQRQWQAALLPLQQMTSTQPCCTL